VVAEGTFGPYRLVSRLGAGGMGEVWRAVDTRKSREVALKLIRADAASDRDFAARFHREAELAARLSSPYIVPIHDYGQVDGQLFLDMALVEGVDLGELLDRDGRLPPERAVRLVGQVARALGTAHRAGLVHRDVKPSNVLIANDGPDDDGDDHAYLIDFGIAKALEGTRLTRSGAIVGTLSYMAPERFAGHGDHRGDVYALTCLLYEVLTGEQPFVADSTAALIYAHLHTRPPSVAGRPAVPAALDAVIARGMAKDPDERYSSAGELATAARAALGVPAPRPAPPPAQSPPETRTVPVSPPTGAQTSAAPRPPTSAPAAGSAGVPTPAQPSAAAARPPTNAATSRPPTNAAAARPPTNAAGADSTGAPPRRPTDTQAARGPARPPDAYAGAAAPAVPPPPGTRRRESTQPGAPVRSRTTLRVLAGAAAVPLVIAAVLGLGRVLVMQQYYVGLDGIQVSIYQGVRGSALGIPLHQLVERSDITINDLTATDRNSVYDGILATDGLDGARVLVQRLRDRLLAPCPPVAPTTAPPAPGGASVETTPLPQASPVPGVTCRAV
jgi:serine/threonine protein kinase